MEQVKGIEPSCSAWEADILPLNYTCTLPKNDYTISHIAPICKGEFIRKGKTGQEVPVRFYVCTAYPRIAPLSAEDTIFAYRAR